jgi:hypothetical protein
MIRELGTQLQNKTRKIQISIGKGGLDSVHYRIFKTFLEEENRKTNNEQAQIPV